MNRSLDLLKCTLAAAGLAPALVSAGNGNTITVDSLQDGSLAAACTLRDAIRSANANVSYGGCSSGQPGQDEIQFAVQGTVNLTEGALEITEDVVISGPGIDQLNIDGQATTRIFEFDGNGANANDIVISDLSLSNVGPNLAGGGAIYLNNVDNTLIERVEIRDGYRGGIRAQYSGNLTVVDSTISNTTRVGISADIDKSSRLDLDNVTLSGNDQGLWCRCELHMINSQVTGNQGTGNAGGIETYLSNVYIADSTISGNSSNNVGGLYLNAYDLEIHRVTISDNQGHTGGGMLVRTLGEGMIEGATISGNVVEGAGVNNGRGGGLFINTRPLGNLKIINSTISGNQAETGGGVYFDRNAAGNTEFEFLTVTNNQATDTDEALGGGISFRVNNANLVIRNSIIADNSASDGQGDDLVAWTRDSASDPAVPGAEIALDYALVEDPIGFAPLGTGNILDASPELDPLEDNGGPTLTHAPRAGSPTLNAGDPDFMTPPEFDQRGAGFARILGGRVDIGALENDFDRLFSDRFEEP